jgi:hypothetical protein
MAAARPVHREERRSGAQPLAAARAPGRDHLAAALGRHAGPETMPALPHELARLVGPFHPRISDCVKARSNAGGRRASRGGRKSWRLIRERARASQFGRGARGSGRSDDTGCGQPRRAPPSRRARPDAGRCDSPPRRLGEPASRSARGGMEDGAPERQVAWGVERRDDAERKLPLHLCMMRAHREGPGGSAPPSRGSPTVARSLAVSHGMTQRSAIEPSFRPPSRARRGRPWRRG